MSSRGACSSAPRAHALIHDPRLILMDEPFGALDALTRERMKLELLGICSESRKTIVFVTHSAQEAAFLGSQCAVLTMPAAGRRRLINGTRTQKSGASVALRPRALAGR